MFHNNSLCDKMSIFTSLYRNGTEICGLCIMSYNWLCENCSPSLILFCTELDKDHIHLILLFNVEYVHHIFHIKFK